MTTMEEIAKKAGVSQATVSRVLNGNPSVHPETRKKVLELIRKLNYQPNAMAQTLATKQSYLLGVILPDIVNPFYAEILKEIERDATLNGYDILFCNTEGNIQRENQHINSLRRRQVNGIFIIPVSDKSKNMDELKKSKIPVVVITQNIEGFDSVSVSHFLGGQQVGRHAMEMGYKKIGFIGDICDDKYLGFKSIMDQYNVEIAAENIIKCINNDTDQIDLQFKDIFQKRGRFDVDFLYAYNDLAAFIAMGILEEFSYVIPKDIAIAGFDNTFLSYEIKPSLTSVAQPISEIGRIAMRIMLEKIESTERKIENIILEPRLIVRESTTSKKY